jgi:hypothetical protein
MSFIAFKREGKEVILNSDRIISVSFNNEKNKTEIICTDQYTIEVDDPEEDVKKRLGVKKGERTIGFGSV